MAPLFRLKTPGTLHRAWFEWKPSKPEPSMTMASSRLSPPDLLSLYPFLDSALHSRSLFRSYTSFPCDLHVFCSSYGHVGIDISVSQKELPRFVTVTVALAQTRSAELCGE